MGVDGDASDQTLKFPSDARQITSVPRGPPHTRPALSFHRQADTNSSTTQKDDSFLLSTYCNTDILLNAL